MKNIVKNSASLLLLLLVGCEKEFTQVDYASDAAWYTSEINKHPDAYRMNLGSVVSFMDASQGCKSHEWIIEDGAKFMVDNFDMKNKDFVSQVDSKKSSISTNAVESVYFGKAGETKVTLRNTFYEWVKSHDSEPIEAVLNGDEWLLEREFKVNVYDVLRPTFEIYGADGELLRTVAYDEEVSLDNKADWTVVELKLGQEIKFKDLKTAGDTRAEWDVPTGATWNFQNTAQKTITRNYDTSNGGVAESPVVAFSFNKMSPEEGFSGFSMTSQRTTPVSSTKKIIPLIVKTVASEAPFTLSSAADAIKVSQDGMTISIMAEGTDGFFGVCKPEAKDDMQLAVTGVTGDPVDGISIAEIAISGNAKSLILTLSERVYPEETITLNYSGSSIIAADYRKLQPVVDKQLTITGGSILDKEINSFEIVSGGFNTIGWTTLGGTFLSDGWLKQVDRIGGAIGDNKKAARLECIENVFIDGKGVANKSFYFSESEAEFIPKGDYKARVSLYLEEFPDDFVAGDDVRFKVQMNKVSPKAVIGTVEYDFTDENKGAWKTFEFDYTHPADTYDKKMQISVICDGKKVDESKNVIIKGAVLWVDDVELIPVRPAAN